MTDALEERMAEALINAVHDFRRGGISTLGQSIGVSDDGIIRLTLQDVAGICAKVARDSAESA